MTTDLKQSNFIKILQKRKVYTFKTEINKNKNKTIFKKNKYFLVENDKNVLYVLIYRPVFLTELLPVYVSSFSRRKKRKKDELMQKFSQKEQAL